ncbi:unnamed protein product, partial [Staurois parvus]
MSCQSAPATNYDQSSLSVPISAGYQCPSVQSHQC